MEAHDLESPHFDGPVCFLIGSRTFSSAVMLANGVGDFHLAMLIGEETGGHPTAFGEHMGFGCRAAGWRRGCRVRGLFARVETVR